MSTVHKLAAKEQTIELLTKHNADLAFDNKTLKESVAYMQTVVNSLISEFDAYKKKTSEEEEVKSKYWRKVYAGQALQGILACPIEFTGRETYEGRAMMSVKHADELLKQLEVK